MSLVDVDLRVRRAFNAMLPGALLMLNENHPAVRLARKCGATACATDPAAYALAAIETLDLKPEAMFSVAELDTWAKANGYVRESALKNQQ